MANKMLIDATHPEETRVVVLRGNRVEEFDFESAQRKQLRGNIYLAKVTRVEPSLQAAFVDYGGNRHGFLAFSEIHPDYYQIPVADRQALIDEEERAHRDAEAEADRRAGMRRQPPHRRAAEHPVETVASEPIDGDVEDGAEAPSEASALSLDHADTVDTRDSHASELRQETELAELSDSTGEEHAGTRAEAAAHAEAAVAAEQIRPEAEASGLDDDDHVAPSVHEDSPVHDDEAAEHEGHGDAGDTAGTGLEVAEARHDDEEGNGQSDVGEGEEEEIVESVGGDDAMEEVPDRAPRPRRQYKIQEVIKRRQIMLVQVVKEERGTKGAALTTYLSLAGRYSVLMPNTARGGGISRKITNVLDRRRLKEIAQELEVPEGMGIILRTAGAARTKTEIKRDFEYLLRAWETVRDLTLNSTAPTLVYEEGSLVKRSIRDLYNKDIDEVVVAGDDAYRDARDFMRMPTPRHAKNVRPYHDSPPILATYGIESQLDAMFSPVVQLRSGGYVVLNQAEALVAIDVNSGRATREHHIEDTALKTNLEASEEIARQLRLRDLAGLIVIDFIDMDEKRNNRSVERRLKECLRHDRARIQVGHISHFGLLEMSRQRIRSSVLESSTEKCSHCGGTGHVRSVSSVALQLLRSLEEMLLKGATHNLNVRTRSDIALYLLNHKRAHLRVLEERFRIAIMVNADATLAGQLSFVIEKGEQVHSLEQAKALALQPATAVPPIEEDEDEGDYDEEEAPESEDAAEGEEQEDAQAAGEEAQAAGEQGQGRRRRRRRRGRRGGEGREAFQHERDEFPPGEAAHVAPAPGEHDSGRQDQALEAGDGGGGAERPAEAHGEGERRRRRRGRRGGRRNRRGREGESFAPETAPEPELAHAVDDLDRPAPVAAAEPPAAAIAESEPRAVPIDEPRGDVQVPAEARPQEAPSAQIADPVPEPTAAEPPRRRSTVREPAPSFAPPVPSIEPVVSSPAESEDGDRPRRSGWWSKRALGKS